MSELVITDQISKILNDAADLLDKDGWCQFTLDYDGNRCILGAINKVATGISEWCTYSPQFSFISSRDRDVAVNRVESLLGLRLSPADQVGFVTDLADWNNAEGRTQFEVTNVLRKAAELGDARDS